MKQKIYNKTNSNMSRNFYEGMEIPCCKNKPRVNPFKNMSGI